MPTYLTQRSRFCRAYEMNDAHRKPKFNFMRFQRTQRYETIRRVIIYSAWVSKTPTSREA